jgi:hypothetical protein
MTLQRPWIVIRRLVYLAGEFYRNFGHRQRPYLHSRALCAVSLCLPPMPNSQMPARESGRQISDGKRRCLGAADNSRPMSERVWRQGRTLGVDAPSGRRAAGWVFSAFSALCTVCGLPGSCLLIDLSAVLEHKVHGISGCRLLLFFPCFRVDE